jgi:LPXTG-motif cell wall-anchored protein
MFFPKSLSLVGFLLIPSAAVGLVLFSSLALLSWKKKKEGEGGVTSQ